MNAFLSEPVEHRQRQAADLVVQFRTVGINKVIVQPHRKGPIHGGGLKRRAVQLLFQNTGAIVGLAQFQACKSTDSVRFQFCDHITFLGIDPPALAVIVLRLLSVCQEQGQIHGQILHGLYIQQQAKSEYQTDHCSDDDFQFLVRSQLRFLHYDVMYSY